MARGRPGHSRIYPLNMYARITWKVWKFREENVNGLRKYCMGVYRVHLWPRCDVLSSRTRLKTENRLKIHYTENTPHMLMQYFLIILLLYMYFVWYLYYNMIISMLTSLWKADDNWRGGEYDALRTQCPVRIIVVSHDSKWLVGSAACCNNQQHVVSDLMVAIMAFCSKIILKHWTFIHAY